MTTFELSLCFTFVWLPCRWFSDLRNNLPSDFSFFCTTFVALRCYSVIDLQPNNISQERHSLTNTTTLAEKVHHTAISYTVKIDIL